MAVTPEEMTKATVLMIFIFLVAVIGGVLFVAIKSALLSLSIAVMVVSLLMIVIYSRELGFFSGFFFVVSFLIVAVATRDAQTSFVFSSLLPRRR